MKIPAALTELTAIIQAQPANITMEDNLTLKEFLSEQAVNSKYQAATQTVGHPALYYSYNHDGIPLWKAPIDRVLQNVVPTTLHALKLCCSHYLAMEAHPAEGCMYDKMCQHFYRIHMASDVYTMVHECRSCAQNRFLVARKQKLQLFAVAGPLEFVTIDILGTLAKTTSGNEHVVTK